jgi:hypothetical protein
MRPSDGVAHWQRTLDQLIWMLMRAGIDTGEIAMSMEESLHRHRDTRALTLPTPEVLEYGRVLTFWRTEPEFLDEQGTPRSLPVAGRAASFNALVRKARPGSNAQHVLRVLRQHDLIAIGRNRSVTLRALGFLPRNAQRAHFVAITLSTLEGIIDTCHGNLTVKNPARHVGHMQRVAMAERFDLKYLEDDDRFLRDQATDFLLKQDEWLKRHEVTSGTARVVQGGMGVFGFRRT